MGSRKDPALKFQINRKAIIEKISRINGENNNNFLKNIELEFFKYVLLASGISKLLISFFLSNI